MSGFGIRSGDVTERPADGLDGGKAPDPLGERLVSLLPPSSLIQRAGGGGQGFKLGQKILKNIYFLIWLHRTLAEACRLFSYGMQGQTWNICTGCAESHIYMVWVYVCVLDV